MRSYFQVLGLLLACFTQHSPLKAQNQAASTPAIRMIARAADGQVMLRWAPSDYASWQSCNATGYIVERFTLMRDGAVLDFAERSVPTILTSTPLSPWSTEEKWKPLMERNEFAAIAAQSLYGEEFTPVSSAAAGNSDMMANITSEQQNRYGFGLFSADHSFEVAQAMALGIVDKTAKPTEQYLYRVYPATPEAAVDTGFVYVAAGQQLALPKVPDLQADFEDRKAIISWNKQLMVPFYVSYLIERSEDGLNWAPIHNAPYVNTDRSERGEEFAYTVDTFALNNRPLFYRVSGRTPFDVYGPPSDIVQGMGISPLPKSQPRIDGIFETEAAAFNVQWSFTPPEGTPMSGYYVQRAPKDEGPYTTVSELLKPEVRSFIDSEPLATNYYKVVSIDAYGRELASFSALAQLFDEEPPAPPQDVRGKIMDDGTLVLTWAPATAPDFYGNRVYIANNEYAEFSQITVEPTTTGFFIDSVTLNTLSPYVYVKVTAQDYRHNMSDFSEMAIVARPDTIPPSAPVFADFQVKNEHLYFAWANSSSMDLKTTELKRRKQNETEWDLVASFAFPEEANTTEFEDASAEPGQVYEYTLTAVDDGGLKTDAKSIFVTCPKQMVRDSLTTLRLSADRRAKQVVLDWTYPDDPDLEYFKVYRAIGDGAPKTYATIAKTDAVLREGRAGKDTRFRYSDGNTKMNSTYHYQVKALFKNGAQTPKSRKVRIDY